MNLREPYAATAFAGLGWSEVSERPIDRVAAAGFADGLGLALWRAKYQYSQSAVVLAMQGLRTRFQARYKSESWDMSQRVVTQCLLEYLKPACEVCLGRGEARLQNGVRIVCRGCGGTQVKRYSDFERARSMQISLCKVRAIAHKIGWLSRQIGSLDAGVNRVMSEQLDRGAAA